MKSVNYTMRYDGVGIDQVYEMLSTERFREEVCDAQRVLSKDVSITPAADGMSVRIRQEQDTQGVPSFAKKIVGESTTVIQEEQWTSHTSAKVTIDVPGKPGDIRGTVSMSADDEGVNETVNLQIKVNIPLVAGKLEGLLADLITNALKAEQRTGKKWLADRG